MTTYLILKRYVDALEVCRRCVELEWSTVTDEDERERYRTPRLEDARELFAALRELDASNLSSIGLVPAGVQTLLSSAALLDALAAKHKARSLRDAIDELVREAAKRLVRHSCPTEEERAEESDDASHVVAQYTEHDLREEHGT